MAQPPVNPNDPRPRESHFSANTAPILAMGLLLITGYLFYHYVDLASQPLAEAQELKVAIKNWQESKLALAKINSDAGSSAQAKEEARLKLELAQTSLDTAKAAVEEVKDRRSMMKDFVIYILGVLSSVLTMVFGYYFGSSKGSATKTEALSAIAHKASGTRPDGHEPPRVGAESAEGTAPPEKK